MPGFKAVGLKATKTEETDWELSVKQTQSGLISLDLHPADSAVLEKAKQLISEIFHQSVVSSPQNEENEASKASSDLDFQLGTNSSHES